MMETSRPIRVVVVDDSQLMRRMITAALEEEGKIEVVAQAADTSEARVLIKQYNPDAITLDVEMPGMNGLAFLEKIMQLRPTPVVMVSTLTAAGADVTLTALRIGAVDAIPKPSGRSELGPFGRALRQKIEMASKARVQYAQNAPPGYGKPHVPTSPPTTFTGGFAHKLIAIGASTGGVNALETVLQGLNARTPPIVITQHMPPMFTSRFADRLNGSLPHDVAEARHGEPLTAGMIRIAPGDSHLCLRQKDGVILSNLDDSGPISGHRPSVDVLFNSVSTTLGRRAMGVILTGMGRDGAAGLSAMRKAGAHCLGQDEASCVVYGMPKAAKELGAVDEQLPLGAIGPRISEILNAPQARRTA